MGRHSAGRASTTLNAGRHRIGNRRRAGRSARAFTAVGALVVAIAPALVYSAPAADAAASTGVSYTLSGCNNDGTITLPNGSGQYVCPDSAYTTGNLGKNWNELDLVPYRVQLTASSGAPSSQTYTFATMADDVSGTANGYDVVSAAVLNTDPAKSAGSCSAASVSAQLATAGNASVYRLVTVTQAAGTTCTYDFYARLALGAHLYPGSSLHVNLANETLGTSGIGNKALSINPGQILPQSISKDMSATQDSDHVWDIVKSPTSASVTFADTCDGTQSLTAPASVTITWTKQAANPSGPITVITHVYATNPAARVVTVDVTDVIYAGTSVIDTASSGAVDVPANTQQLVLSHTTTVPAGTTGLNDVATATYTDKVTGVPVPGDAQATASATVQPSGTTLNDSATITDLSALTGSNLAYSVDSATGATGSFGSYVPGTPTTDQVTWTSDPQSSSGSVTLDETVYTPPASVSTGTLADTATVNGSDGFTASTSASVSVSANATTSLAVSKSTNLQIATAQTFTFHLYDAATNTPTGDTVNVSVPALGNGPVTSGAVTGLDPNGSYYFVEDATAPYASQQTATQTFDLTPGDPSTCTATIPVRNQAGGVTAQVRKDTLPASSGDWTFTLTGPGGLSQTLDSVQAGAGYVPFPSGLSIDGGTYTITETPQTGYDINAISGDVGGNAGRVSTDPTGPSCSFTLDLVTDSGQTFECSFTNAARGHIVIRKVTLPSGSTQSFDFTTDYGPGFSLTDGTSNDSGLIKAGTYHVSEAATAGWDQTSDQCDNGDTADAIQLQVGQTVTCTFVNTQRGHVRVVKTVAGAALTGSQSYTFQLRQGTSTTQAGTILETGTATAGNGGVISFAAYLVPGSTYQLCEVVSAGWSSSLGPNQFTAFDAGGDNSVKCANLTVAAGETKTINVDNTPPPVVAGGQRTIGYWKNWSSCSASSKTKAPVLDRTLLAAAQAGTPIRIGILVLDPTVLGASTACKDATALLNKSTLSGTKKASDPLWNMAAQLLAAKLNVQAGASICPAVTAAITSGQGLLAARSFNGSTYSGKLTSAQTATANAVATTLDKYNNGLLC